MSRAVVSDADAFAEIVAWLRDQEAFALDTEFHRERTYYPKLALLQVAAGNRLEIVDPLAVDIAPLSEVLEGPGLAVLHAASQDLEVLQHACGTGPSRLFDTQIAAGFLGLSSPSLATLHDRELGIKLAKGDRLTDWLRRPLTDNQLEYAASDVAHLLEIHERQVAQLVERGRLEWVEHECELARRRGTLLRDPEGAYSRIKEARHLKGAALGVVKSMAAWRERRAAQIDQPVRFVMSDMALVGVAQRKPKSRRDLAKIRGLDERSLKDRVVDEVLDAVAEGLAAGPPEAEPRRQNELARELRPAVGLVSAWVSQLAKDLEIETAMLATRGDIEALLRGDADARLAEGWRAEQVGAPIRDLVEGRAALAFDGAGGVLLEARSHLPV